ncbi:MAG TPA: hypothetical protein VFN56_03010 [Candidatus Saccharimonadales bacterium]|nr:hypothetical protein [Candidatus Saccharimonadales bacterium]
MSKSTFTLMILRQHESMRTSVTSANQGRLRTRAYFTSLVLLSVLFVTFLESHVSILRNGLAGTLYVVVVVVAAMRNFLASVFAVLGGVVGLYYVHPWDSAHLERIAVFKFLNFPSLLLSYVLSYGNGVLCSRLV